MIVVDTNVIAGLYLPGPDTGPIRELPGSDPEWVAPKLWRSELRNVLARYHRSGEMSIPEMIRVMTEAESVLRGNEYEVPSTPILELAAKSGCSAYDCEFVALAKGLDVPLVTLDRYILRAFPETAISIENFLQR